MALAARKDIMVLVKRRSGKPKLPRFKTPCTVCGERRVELDARPQGHSGKANYHCANCKADRRTGVRPSDAAEVATQLHTPTMPPPPAGTPDKLAHDVALEALAIKLAPWFHQHGR